MFSGKNYCGKPIWGNIAPCTRTGSCAAVAQPPFEAHKPLLSPNLRRFLLCIRAKFSISCHDRIFSLSLNNSVLLVTRKSRTLELLAFDEYRRFDNPAFYYVLVNKMGLVLFTNRHRQQKYQNGNIHLKLKVTTSRRQGKLSNPRARAACPPCLEKIREIYGNQRADTARALCINFAVANSTVVQS
jgi:hypothetical protein